MLLALVCQFLADVAALPSAWMWLARVGVPIAAILIPAGFFLSVPSPASTHPNGLVSLIYAGAFALAGSVLSLVVGLLRSL